MRITLRRTARNIVLIMILIFLLQIFYNTKTPQLEGRLVLHIEQYGNGKIGTTKEPDYSGPIDLVYLWVNGSEPKFILEMKLQKASEDFDQYKSSISCSYKPDIEESLHVLVVYPALHSTKSLTENKNIEYIYNVTDNDMTYSIIIPKQWDKGIMDTLTVIEGRTYLSMCGIISHQNLPTSKITLEHTYIVISNNLDTVTSVMKRLSESHVGYVFNHDEEAVPGGKYTILCYKRHTSSDIFKKIIEDLRKLNVDIKPAILAWDTDSIKIEGLPDKNRYAENDQLIYSIRSVEENAPWIRNIYIVTNDQTPSWLNTSHEKISVISTKEIFPNPNDLPTFSSPAIESHMYRIPGLSETFIFMCDDFFFGKPVTLSDFYTKEDGLKIYWDVTVPTCWFKCSNTMLGNGICDSSCDNLRCGWDHGDCRNITNYHIKQKYPLIFAGNFKGSVYNTIAMFNRRSLHNDGTFNFNYPPHKPLLVNRQIASDLYKTFQAEFERSSSIHFRSQFNVQYTLAYMLFISTAHVALTPEHVFDELDKDKSGKVSFNDLQELQYMNFKSLDKDIEYLIDATVDCLRTRTVELDNKTFGQNYYSIQLTKSAFLQCSEIVDYIRRKGVLKQKYKYTLDTDENYHFIIIHNLMAKARWDLNSVINNLRKFVCINDNMDHSKMVATAVEQELKRFYESLFPKPSQYERRVS